jgi:phosphoribosylformimino-5-aminoimidazole carboxamide ribotide isomerase
MVFEVRAFFLLRVCVVRSKSKVMRVVPVLDLMSGEVVRGVGGRRHEYRRVVSRLTESSQPCEVARALQTQFGCRQLYVADLDAIGGREPVWSIYSQLQANGFHLWVDAGIRDLARSCQLVEARIETIVVGLETIAGPDALAAIARQFGERIVFSLDLQQAEPLGDRHAWGERDAEEIAAQAIQLGVRRLLLLDLADVGSGSGTSTCALCAWLHAEFPEVELSAGGGVRDRGDLLALRECGVQVVLVASALHDGRLTRADLERL